MKGWYLVSADTPASSYCKDFCKETAFASPDGEFGIADRKPGYPNYRTVARRCGGATGAMREAEDHFARLRLMVLSKFDYEGMDENEWLAALEEDIRAAAARLRNEHGITAIAVLKDSNGDHTVVEATPDNVPDHFPL